MQTFSNALARFFDSSRSLEHTVRRYFSLTAIILVSAIGFGCGGGGEEGPALFPVKGTVTFDNTPIETGRIQFRKADSIGKAYSAEIINGAYQLEVEAGKMKVEVTASRIVPGKFSEPASPDEEPQPLGEMYIPEQYNTKTTLEAEVKAGDTNEIPFNLTSE